jgi:hypothetical protein
MRARTAVALTLIAIAVWWWRDDPAPRHAEGPPQLAVLHDGFVVMRDDGHGKRRLTELDRDGKARRDHTFASSATEVRAVGTRVGAGVVWRDTEARKVRVAIVDRNGKWRLDPFTGDQVRSLCAGHGSNDDQFTVGWINDRGEVWWVYGPTQPAASDLTERGASWCAVASAGDGVGVIWRERDRLLINVCSNRGCPMAETVSREIGRRPILGFGCIWRECVVVTRGASQLEATLLTRTGRVKWTRPLPGEHAGDAVHVVGTGDKRFVVAYGTRAGIEVVAFDRKGTLAPIASLPGTAPAIAWSQGRLALARLRGGQVVTEILAMPRVKP